MVRSPRLCRVVASVCLSALFGLTACGGGGGGGDDSTTPPPVVVPPRATASFTAPATADANQPVVFDAGASTASDGGALSYSWDFGDGQRGGGRTIARSFGSGGMRSVTLTVVDGAQLRDTQTRTLMVAAPAAGASVTVAATITGLDGAALEGVALTPAGGGAAATTDAMGRASLALASNLPLTLKLTKAGYADQFVGLKLPAGSGADAFFEAVLRPRDAALTLADAAAGGTLAGRDGAAIILPPGALVNGAGTPVTGAVQIAITPVDVTLPAAGGFPGSFEGIKADGVTTPIVSFGVAEFVLGTPADRLQLAAGKTATIEVPIYGSIRPDGTTLAAGDSIPLWSLDETTSMWIQEGSGIAVASAASPSGLAMRAIVSHFTWWNADIGFEPYGPQPKCAYDTDSGVPGGNDTFATATICNMLAEMDRGLGGNQAARARPLQAAPLPPRIAGYSRRDALPIAGGVTVPVPAGYNVALQATALNGSWIGRRVVNGAVGVREEVVVLMRPLAGTGPTVEAVTTPFDTTRSLLADQTARFSFAGTAVQYARVTVQPVNGSTLTGRVRLMQGTTALGSGNFGPATATLLVGLPADATYVVEVEPLTNAPGGYRVQIALLGGLQTEALAFPFDITRSLPAYTPYQGSFDIAVPGASHFAFQPRNNAVSRQVRLLAPDGSVAYSDSSIGSIYTFTVALATAGRYRFETSTATGAAGDFRLTAEPASWLPLGAGHDTDSGFEMVDLVADRNGKPVVGFRRNPVVNAQRQQTIVLRRWTGSVWESVGSDLTIEAPCSGTRMASFAFDSGNVPLIVYGSVTPSGSITSVRRFSGGAWQPVGPDDGKLKPSAFTGACADPPKIVVDAADRPIIAYRADNNLWVQRLDAGVWQGLGTPTGDAFMLTSGMSDLKLDPAGAPWTVLRGSDGYTTVRRFDATSSSWLSVGPGGGVLPQPNAFLGLVAPRLRFAADGTPNVGAIAGVGSGSTGSPGVAVYRFDGSAWNTSGGFQLAGSYLNNTPEIGFALSGSDALLAWQNQNATTGAAIVVQRNNAAGAYAPVGAGLGEVVQYWAHGITPDQSPLDTRLLTIGSDVYLAIVVRALGSGTSTGTFKVTLLKKVGP